MGAQGFERKPFRRADASHQVMRRQVGQHHTAARMVCPKRSLTSASWGSITLPQQTRVARGSTRISCCKPTRSPASRLSWFAGAFIMVVPLEPFRQ